MSKLRIPNIGTKAPEPEPVAVEESAPKPKASSALVIPEPDGSHLPVEDAATRRVLITEPGLYQDMAAEDYFSEPCPEPALTNTGIGYLIDQSPEHFAYHHPAIGQPPAERKATIAMYRGSVVHRLALGAGKDYTVINAPDFMGADARAAKKYAERKGKVPILKGHFEKAQAEANVLYQHIKEVLHGEQFLSEVVVAWKVETAHGEIWARCMVDAWCPTLMRALDIKTTTDASEEAVIKRMVDGGYDTQDVWYRKGIEHVLGCFGRVAFTTLFSEVAPPYCTHPVSINEAWATSAWDLCEEAAETFGRCMKEQRWPGYPRETQKLAPPDWLINQRLARRFSLGADE